MDTLAHVVPAVGDRPNGCFPPLGAGLPWRVCIFVVVDGLPSDSQGHAPIQGFRRLPSWRTVSRSSMLRSR